MSLYFCSLSPFRTISGGCRLNRNVLFQPVRQSRVFTLNLLRRQKKETPQKTEIQKQDLQFYFKFFLRRPQLLLLASAGSEINIYINIYYIFIYKKQSFTKIPRSKLVFTGRLSLLETSHTTKASDYCILHLDLSKERRKESNVGFPRVFFKIRVESSFCFTVYFSKPVVLKLWGAGAPLVGRG